MRLVLNKVTPSLNETDRWHWAVKRRHRNEWAALLLGQIRRQGLTKAKGKRRVTITRVCRGGGLDMDNCIGGVKMLLDEIKTFGLVIDDRPEFCELIVLQEKPQTGLANHTVVVLEDL